MKRAATTTAVAVQPRLLIFEQLSAEWLWPSPTPRGRHHWRTEPWPYAATYGPDPTTEGIPLDTAKHREVR